MTEPRVDRMRPHQIAGSAAALVVAALVATVGSFGLIGPVVLLLFPIVFGIALAFGLVVGVPLFLMVRDAGRVNACSAIVGGVAVALLAGVIFNGHYFGYKSGLSVNGVALVVDGWPTAAGWLSYAKTMLVYALIGAAAGAAFWGVLKGSGATEPVPGKSAGATPNPVGGFSPELSDSADRTSPSTGGHRLRIGVAVGSAVAILAIVALAATPYVFKDKSCHNISRDRTLRPRIIVRIDLGVFTPDWPQVVQAFQEFSKQNELSFRNTGRDQFGERGTLRLSLCDEGATIQANPGPWAAGVGILVFEMREGSAATLAAGLREKLEALWPGKVVLRDAVGRLISSGP